MKAALLLVLILLSFLVAVDAAKILIVVALESKSHTNIHEAVARTLGSKGHQVTFLSPYPMSSQWPNVEWYQIGQPQDAGLVQFDIYDSRKQTFLSMLLQAWADGSLYTVMELPCENLYKTPKVKSILEEVEKKGKIYDVGIWDALFSEHTVPFLGLVANHTAMLSVVPLPQWIAHYFRIPFPTSVLPSFMSHFSAPADFWQRMESMANTYMFIFYYHLLLLSKFQNLASSHLPPHAPLLEDVLKNVSFIFTNEDPVLVEPRPTNPFVAAIGGIHLQKSKPLSKEFEDFMQSSGDHGVILFSFGSYFDTKLMPKDMRDAFINAFGRMKQKVIWKYHEPIDGISDNVKIVKWMPQRDILAHPKLRLFITHGGRLSSMEVAYHGVPMVGIALFADQMQNVHRLVSVGMGLEIDILDLTADRIYDTAMAIINNSSFAERTKKLSSIFRDKQNSPDETLNYWIEYIVRHDGAPHLKNMAQHLVWYQYVQLDIIIVMLLFLILFTLINVLGIKLLIKRFQILKGSKTKNKKD